MLHFPKALLVDLKMSSRANVMFCMFCLANIWQKVLEHFSHSSSLLIMAQSFAPFDCYTPLGVTCLVNFQLLV